MARRQEDEITMRARELAVRWLRNAFEVAKISQTKAARRAGVYPAIISRIASGHTNPRLETIVRIIEKGCGLRIEDLRVLNKKV